MSQIIQTLGFDVSGALAGISSLNKSMEVLNNTLEQSRDRLSKFNTQLTRLNKLIGTSATATAQFQASLAALGTVSNVTNNNISNVTNNINNITNVAGSAAANTQRLTTSLGLLSRIVFTQMVIKGLREMEQLLLASARRAAELQIKIAEIQGVDDEGRFASAGDIRNRIEGLSNAMGISSIEAAAGVYQSLQNQIGGTVEEIIQFNKVATEFGLATSTSQEDSVNLLSATLNAFQMDVSRTEEIASKFNKAIEVGVIEGDELAHSLGRVMTRARSLGVSLEEVLGMYATLTVRGVNPNEAATQIGALISAFTKPSEAMAKALEKLKVPSGEFLINAYGLAEALKMVQTTTDGSASAIAKLYPNIRAVNGVAVYMSDTFELLSKNIEKINNTDMGLNQSRSDRIRATDAKKIEEEINRFKNAMNSAGFEVLKFAAAQIEAVGGVDTIIKSLGPITMALGGVAGAFIATNLAASAAAAGVTRFGVSMSTVFSSVARGALLAGLITGTVALIDTMWLEVSQAPRKALEQERGAYLEAFRKTEEERLKVSRDTNSKIVKDWLQAAHQQISIQLELVNSAKAADQANVTSANNTLNRIVETRQKLLSALETAANDSATTVERSQRRIQRLVEMNEDRKFTNNVSGRSDKDQINMLMARSQQVAAAAAKKLRDSVTESQQAEAQAMFDRAQRFAEMAEDAAEKTNSQDNVLRAQGNLNRLTNVQIAAEKRLQSAQESNRQLLEQRVDTQRNATEILKEQARIINENLGSTGDGYADRERANNLKKAFEEIEKIALSSEEFDLAQMLGLHSLGAEIQRQLGQEVKLSTNVAQFTEQTQSKLNAAFSEWAVKVNLDIPSLESVSGMEIGTVDQVNSAITRVQEELTKVEAELSKVNQAKEAAFSFSDRTIEAELNEIGSLYSVFQRSLRTDSLESVNSLSSQRASIAEELRTIKADSVVTNEELERFIGLVVKYKDTVGKSMGGSMFGPATGDLESYMRIIDVLTKANEAGAIDTTDQEARLRELEAVMQRLNDFSQSQQPVLDATPLTEAGKTVSYDMQTGAQIAADIIRGAARDYASIVASAVPPMPQSPMYANNGGLVGKSRGMDTRSAMLRVGESVNTEKATRRFYSDIQRMNAGSPPRPASNMSSGNITVGDVHIHGSTNSNISPRQIAQHLARETRRRTIS